MGMAERIIIRLAERQNRLWRLAAAAEGLSLSAWLRQLADRRVVELMGEREP